MEKIVLVGGAGTGKSNRLLNEAYAQSCKGKETIVVFKTFAMFEYYRKLLGKTGIKAKDNPLKPSGYPDIDILYVEGKNGGHLEIIRIDGLAHYIQYYHMLMHYDWEQIGWDHYKKFIEENELKLCDYIFIDEAQDFEKVMFESLEMLAKNGITVTYSESQSLFRNNMSDPIEYDYLKNKGYKEEVLKEQYRMTPEVYKLAVAVQNCIESEIDAGKIREEDAYKTDNPNRGFKPLLFECENKQDEVNKLVEYLKGLDLNKYNVAIISKPVTSKEFKNHIQDDRHEDQLKKRLTSEGIVIRDAGNVTEPGVRVTSVAAIKGSEYHIVILFLDNDTFWGPYDKYTDKYSGPKGLYTAISRAMNNVCMFRRLDEVTPYGNRSESYYLKNNIITSDIYDVVS